MQATKAQPLPMQKDCRLVLGFKNWRRRRSRTKRRGVERTRRHVSWRRGRSCTKRLGTARMRGRTSWMRGCMIDDGIAFGVAVWFHDLSSARPHEREMRKLEVDNHTEVERLQFEDQTDAMRIKLEGETTALRLKLGYKKCGHTTAKAIKSERPYMTNQVSIWPGQSGLSEEAVRRRGA